MIEFNVDRHEYRIDGRVVPSVTQIINAVIRPDHHGSEVALARGSFVHRFIVEHFADDEDPPEGIADTIAAFRAFRNEVGLEAVALEQRGYDAEFGVCGTLDCIGRARHLDNALYLIDWKSGPVQPWDHLQIAAYGRMVKLALWPAPILVSLKRKLPRPVPMEDSAPADWAAVARTYHWMQRNGG